AVRLLPFDVRVQAALVANDAHPLPDDELVLSEVAVPVTDVAPAVSDERRALAHRSRRHRRDQIERDVAREHVDEVYAWQRARRVDLLDRLTRHAGEDEANAKVADGCVVGIGPLVLVLDEQHLETLRVAQGTLERRAEMTGIADLDRIVNDDRV